MAWTVLFHEEFDVEFQALDHDLQDELLAHAKLLQEFGPKLGRPAVDTLIGSKHANMKELRFGWKGQVWRIAFAFDPERHAILLAGGDKRGADSKRFYGRLIMTADRRFDRYVSALKPARAGPKPKESSRAKKP